MLFGGKCQHPQKLNFFTIFIFATVPCVRTKVTYINTHSDRQTETHTTETDKPMAIGEIADLTITLKNISITRLWLNNCRSQFICFPLVLIGSFVSHLNHVEEHQNARYFQYNHSTTTRIHAMPSYTSEE